jgi:MprA protease rhombosortase-interaction domain-containing protein
MMGFGQFNGWRSAWLMVFALGIWSAGAQACMNTGDPLEPCHCKDKMMTMMTLSVKAAATPTVSGGATPAATASDLFNAQVGDNFFNYNGNFTGDVTIHAGDTVQWAVSGFNGHTVTSLPGQADPFGSTVLTDGDTFQHTFNTPGTYVYYCEIHDFVSNGQAIGPQVGHVTVLAVPEPAGAAIIIMATLAGFARRRRGRHRQT